MANTRTIEIDFEVHKQIETARTSFAETPNDVLRRLLRMGSSAATVASPGSAKGRPWAGKGVWLPHGTEVRMEYNGRVHQGRIENGQWLVEGKTFKSPSAAAGGVALTKAGRPTSLDGWIYWQVKRPEDMKWIPIDALRSSPA